MKIKIPAQHGQHRESLVTALACLGHSAKVIEEKPKAAEEPTKFYVVVEFKNTTVIKTNENSF